MIQLYCGDGKGKTTAAVGAAVRAAGRGRNVIFAQFLKGQETGELRVLSEIAYVRILRFARPHPFYAQMTEGQKRELTDFYGWMLEEIDSALRFGSADFVVLDEITHACRLRMADERKLEQILALGKEAPEVEIILTGRMPSARMTAESDYISEIRSVRHPYEKGTEARDGVER